MNADIIKACTPVALALMAVVLQIYAMSQNKSSEVIPITTTLVGGALGTAYPSQTRGQNTNDK